MTTCHYTTLKHGLRLLAGCLAALSLAACVPQHDTRSQVSALKTPLGRSVISVVAADPALQSETLLAIRRELASRGISAEPEEELFADTRSYTPLQTRDALIARGIDNVILVSLDKPSGGIENPLFRAYASSTDARFSVGNWGYSSMSSKHGSLPVRFYSPIPNAAVILLDSRSGAAVWSGRSAAASGGEAVVSAQSLARAMARNVTAQLEADGLLAPRR